MSNYTIDTLPDWVKVGAEVASIRHGWNSHIDFEGTIIKIGKRDIIVALLRSPEVTRTYRVKDLKQQGVSYGPGLYRLKGSEVRKIREAERQQWRINAARDRVDDWLNDKHSSERVVDLISAMVEVLPPGDMKRGLAACLAFHTPAPEADDE